MLLTGCGLLPVEPLEEPPQPAAPAIVANNARVMTTLRVFIGLPPG